MALDGIFLRHIAKEIEETALGGRIAQIYQPNRDELVISLRTYSSVKKLLVSARANSPRIHFTEYAPENPAVPPMFCMLLRKKLGGGKLAAVRQQGSDRTLFLDFDCVNELGDCVRLTLAAEIMGKHSNVILIGGNGLIVDSLKRVDMTMSNLRLVLPNLKYEPAPLQDKLDMLSCSAEQIVERALSLPAEMSLNKAFLNVILGVSPIVCRELESIIGADATNKNITDKQKVCACQAVSQLIDTAVNCSGMPYMVCWEDGRPFDITFLPVSQYRGAAQIKSCESFSKLLDEYFTARDSDERMRAKAQDLYRLAATLTERLSRKINVQTEELKSCANRETLRVYADLLQANLYRIERGSTFADVENFYDENMTTVRIPLNPALSPAANSQKYYKDYRKAKTREQKLAQQIEKAKQELEYMQSVTDELSRAQSEKELSQIRAELCEQGFIKAPKGKPRPQAKLEPHKFVTENGFTVLVGRNNKQNDILTLKTAAKNDIWFHTKDIHGSHVILVTGGAQPEESDMLAAAELAAYYSKARGADNVAVDYTLAKFVSKPGGARPGMVIYVNQKTLYIDARSISGAEEIK